MATEYSNKKMLNSNPTKICTLPDSVLCTVLSFLEMIEVVRTSLISRRWRYLWASVPVLDFDQENFEEATKMRKEFWERGFLNFVDKVLFLRDSSQVSRLKISTLTYDTDRIVAWLTVAARRQFQEIHLHLGSEIAMELPHLLFTSAVTVFNLQMNMEVFYGFRRIKVPNSVSLSPQLKTLKLDWVQFPMGNLNGEFTLSCPVLEHLSLMECDQRHLNSLILAAPQLKNLVINNSDPDCVGSCAINIWTPNIVSLSCGFCYRKYSFMNYSSLVDAKIQFSHEQPGDHDLVELLGAISCAKTIALYFGDSLYKLNDLNNQFTNLGHLKLRTGYGEKLCTRVVLQLLMIAPSVETLIMEADDLEDYEEEVVSFECSHLKYVEIGKVKGHELKFLKFLLKNAVVLEKLKIRMCHNSSVSARENLGKKILSLPRMSASTTVVIV